MYFFKYKFYKINVLYFRLLNTSFSKCIIPTIYITESSSLSYFISLKNYIKAGENSYVKFSLDFDYIAAYKE